MDCELSILAVARPVVDTVGQMGVRWEHKSIRRLQFIELESPYTKVIEHLVILK